MKIQLSSVKKLPLWLLGIAFVVTSQCTLAIAEFSESTFTDLDYGFYFFGKNDAYEKYQPGQRNRYFDPSKPTMVYLHGWQNGMVEDMRRETFDTSDIIGAPEGIDLAASWINDGYNVAIYYWTQFADESEVQDAEEKIWPQPERNNPRRLSWRSYVSQGQTETNNNGPQNTSISELFVEEYLDVFQDASNIRLAGHSLGAQLMIVASQQLLDAVNAGALNTNALPNRLALLDPFFSNGEKDYLNNRWTGQVARDYADNLKNAGVLIEAYRSSPTTSTIFVGDANNELLQKTAFSELAPWYFWAWQFTEKHVMARWWYLLSYNSSTLNIENNNNRDALSASASNQTVRYWMNSNQRLVQTEGRRTERVSDDQFTQRNR
ncbi:hypothetical protein [Marinibactrum halimedae]|uniref:Cell adhesion protein n=1 Tax=Marinibactrum halimedae TaxID=1444977 RepID=A0AA37T7Z5_9GAMM|nr:hypothetical protein [Marinibactrum halimedae]MCD9460883.1 hypothetical protein [Marinibactrum halimedae]GLS27339.1 cell adhesion protein [Marinibactrum halimedae]